MNTNWKFNVNFAYVYIDEDTCNYALRSLVISWKHYCISFLIIIWTVKENYKPTKKVQNRAARLVVRANCREHTIPLLREQHLLQACQVCVSVLSLNCQANMKQLHLSYKTPWNLTIVLIVTCYFVHMLMNIFLYKIELTPRTGTMYFVMLCQLSEKNKQTNKQNKKQKLITQK